METTRQLFVYLINPEDYVFGEEPHTYVTDTSGMEKQGWVQLFCEDVSITHELPSREEMRGKTVEQIRDQIKQIDATAQRAKTELEGKIQNLLAIGHEEPQKLWKTATPNLDDDIPF